MRDPNESPKSKMSSDLAQAVADLDASDFAMPSVVGPEDDPDAPRLPLSDDEPMAVPAVDPSQLKPDLAMLQKLDAHRRTRNALVAALAGEPYDDAALPETRALVIGLMRVLVQNGVDTGALVNAVLEAVND